MVHWAALEIGLWTRIAAELDNTIDKAAMRLVCKSLDVAASLAVTELPGRLAYRTKELHAKDGKSF